ncbi:hypothetical protein [Parafrigoribacterium soli]|uniref:hypothetical protein n=1 Tax=Parafrigoribacterium soli TaxID=3144663 RepID=UPI0032EC06FB
MRFVFAIVSFVLAFVLIGYGVAQRTIFAGPDHVTASVSIDSKAPVTVIDGTILNAKPGHQTVEISGASKIFAAYGRTQDVHAWVGNASYNRIGFNSDKQVLTSTTVTGKPDASTPDSNTSDAGAPATSSPQESTPAPGSADAGTADSGSVDSGKSDSSKTTANAQLRVPDPHGSDLWLDERSSDSVLEYTMNVPKGISVIIASDGSHAAPSKVAVRWPLDNRTPWSGPLVIAGVLLLLIGLGLYLWALYHLRKARGPRRKSPKMPKVPRQRRYKPRRTVPPVSGNGRRRSTHRRMIAVVPVLVISSLALSGCSPDAWPAFLGGSGNKPVPTATAKPDVTSNQQQPAVTFPQLKQIVAKASTTAAKADETLDTALLETRFAGPALELRKTNYELRKKDSTIAAPAAIPQSEVEIALPQQSDGWPRTVFTVLVNPKDKTVSPMALMLQQAAPRDNYKISYAIGLEPKIVLPHLAAKEVGAPRLLPDNKLELLPPGKIGTAYGDLLLKGPDSEFAKYFDTSNDHFEKTQGVEAKKARKAGMPAKVGIDFSNEAGAGETIAFGTNNSGAIVATNLTQIETAIPTEAGASLNSGSLVKTLTGITSTLKGLVTYYGDQLLFYVPKAGSNQKIVLLGAVEGIISAKEKP